MHGRMHIIYHNVLFVCLYYCAGNQCRVAIWNTSRAPAPSTQPLRFDPRQSRKWPGPERLASSVAELLSAAVNGQEAASVQPEGMG